MPAGMTIFGTEGGPEGENSRETRGINLSLKLTGDREMSRCPKESAFRSLIPNISLHISSQDESG